MISRLISFWVYSNLFISFCAAALTAEVFVLFNVPLENYWFLIVIACSTLLVYNLHYLVKSKGLKTDSRLQWVRNNTSLFYTISVIALLVLLLMIAKYYHIFFLEVSTISWYKISLFIALPFLSIWYSHKIIPGVKTRTREWFWLKPVYLAAIWVIATGLVPLLFVAKEVFIIEKASILAFLFFQFAFILSLCVLFNVRDVEEDKQDGLQTLAVKYGTASVLNYGKWIAVILNLVAATVFLIVYPHGWVLIATGILITLYLLWRLFHYFVWRSTVANFAIRYDGLMIIKAALLIFAKLIT